MSIKPDSWIKKMAMQHAMIEPFEPRQVRQQGDEKIISWGLSSYGYDIRVSDQYRIFTNVYGSVVDPKNFDPNAMVEFVGDVCLIPPNSFALAISVETFNIPRDVMTVCLGKSTYARCGIIVNVTPFEPGWRGRAVLEISNTTALPARIYSNEGLAQVLFFQSDTPCDVSYADRGGKYQNQSGMTGPVI